jgi:two-component system, NarL family, sensor histidine kinase DegS
MTDAAATPQRPTEGGTSIDFEAPGAGSGQVELEHLRRVLEATERRLARLGFDLHDGPLQDLSALAGEVRHLAEQLASIVPAERVELLAGRFDDVLGRITSLDADIRELVRSLEPRSLPDRPLRESLEAEVASFQETGQAGATLELTGSLDGLTRSQRIAVLRVVQEALTNAREHSGATEVHVTVSDESEHVHVRVVDNGCGFDPQAALTQAERHGRLGVVGMGERVRLLGGSFSIESAPGGPTSVTALVPRWEPGSDQP